MSLSFYKARGRAAINKNKQTKEAEQTTVSDQCLKQARKTGQLNLSGRSLCNVPGGVWRLNIDRPNDSHVASIDGGDDAWWDQIPLTKLILASNRLTEIPDQITYLDELTVLDVRNNCLEKVTEAIGELVQLQKLVLSHNKLSCLPSSIEHLVNLGVLHLEHNQLAEISFNIGSLQDLLELNLSNNQLSCIPADIHWLKKLTSLNIAQNSLTELPTEIGSLRSLKVLDASHTSLHTVPESLGDLRNLELLYLQQNKLTSLPVLTHCSCIKEVQLGNNLITDVPSEILKTYTHIVILDLRDNKISALPETVGQLHSLERLTVSNNDISSLPAVIGTLVNLKTLQLDGNPLRSIRRDIVMRGTEELKKYLRSRMTELEAKQEVERQSQNEAQRTAHDQDEFGLNNHEIHQLKNLDLSNKNLTTVSDRVWKEVASVGITTVNLSKNHFTDLPTGLMVTSDTLKDLQIGNNRISHLSPDIGLYLYLVSLDLRNNSLTTLPEELSSIKNLREIVLSCNKFSQIPAVVYSLRKLEVLFANDNQLTSMDVAGLLELKTLGTLDLRNNNISVVPPELGKMNWLKSLQLSGNAFRHPRPALLVKGTEALLAYLRDKITETN